MKIEKFFAMREKYYAELPLQSSADLLIIRPRNAREKILLAEKRRIYRFAADYSPKYESQIFYVAKRAGGSNKKPPMPKSMNGFEVFW